MNLNNNFQIKGGPRQKIQIIKNMKFRGHFGLKLDDLEHLGVLVEGGVHKKQKIIK